MSEHSADELKRQLDQLEGRIGQLRGSLREAEEQKAETEQRYYEAMYAVRRGEQVLAKGKTYQIARIDRAWHGQTKPCLYGYLVKKDGGVSDVRHYLSTSWERP